MGSDTVESDTERLTLSEIEDVISEAEAEILAEDKLGASRNDVVEGTCQRIFRRLRSVDTGTDREGSQ